MLQFGALRDLFLQLLLDEQAVGFRHGETTLGIFNRGVQLRNGIGQIRGALVEHFVLRLEIADVGVEVVDLVTGRNQRALGAFQRDGGGGQTVGQLRCLLLRQGELQLASCEVVGEREIELIQVVDGGTRTDQLVGEVADGYDIHLVLFIALLFGGDEGDAQT